MHAPARMSARDLQRIVSARLGAVFVRGQVLIEFQVPVVVDVELDAAGQSRVGLLFLDVPGEGNQGFTHFYVTGVAQGAHRCAKTGVSCKASLLDLFPADLLYV